MLLWRLFTLPLLYRALIIKAQWSVPPVAYLSTPCAQSLLFTHTDGRLFNFRLADTAGFNGAIKCPGLTGACVTHKKDHPRPWEYIRTGYYLIRTCSDLHNYRPEIYLLSGNVLRGLNFTDLMIA